MWKSSPVHALSVTSVTSWTSIRHRVQAICLFWMWLTHRERTESLTYTKHTHQAASLRPNVICSTSTKRGLTNRSDPRKISLVSVFMFYFTSYLKNVFRRNSVSHPVSGASVRKLPFHSSRLKPGNGCFGLMPSIEKLVSLKCFIRSEPWRGKSGGESRC